MSQPIAWDAFLARLRSGERMASLYGQPGMPSRNQYLTMWRKNPGFAAEVEATNPDRRRPNVTTPRPQDADWGEALARVGQGERPIDFCGAPGLPTRQQWYDRYKADKAFRAEVDGRAVQAGLPVRHRVTVEIIARALELRKKGVSMERISAMPGMPDWSTIDRWLAQHPQLKAKFQKLNIVQAPVPLSAKERSAILTSIANVGTEATCRGGGISERRLRRIRKEDPDFDQAIKAIVERRFRERGKGGGELDVAAIDKAVPRTLPPVARDEIKAAMAAAIVEGTLRPEDIARRAKEFVTAYYRTYSEYGPASLDQKLFDDGEATLGDTIDGNAFRF